MKKFISALFLLFTVTVSASAMSYEQARQQALFLTDKMAYELNLNEAQYEAAYEVNLDYLMNVMTPDDLYGLYWTRRNLDLSYILFDWQYNAFCAASYFYRPLYWDAGFWHFGIYSRYPHRDYFYFGRPAFINVYRGGHSWHHNGDRSWYRGRDFGNAGRRDHFGMRDGFDRGNYGRGQNIQFGNQRGNSPQRNGQIGNSPRNNQQPGNGNFGSRRNNNGAQNRDNGQGFRFGGSRSNNNGGSSVRQNSTFSPRNNGTPNNVRSNTNRRSSSATFGGSRMGNSRSNSIDNSRGLINRSNVGQPSTSGSRSNSFSGNRSSFGGNRGGSTFSGKSSSPSFSGGSKQSAPSRSSSGGGHSGGGSFGGRR